jgi:hypothetical protein
MWGFRRVTGITRFQRRVAAVSAALAGLSLCGPLSAAAQMQIVNSIITVAGNNTAGYIGDNAQASSAELSTPNRVAVDGFGNIYISDNANARVRKVNIATGVITTVAGNGTAGYNGDNGLATSAEISPNGVAADAFGNVYIADAGNSRVRKVTASTGIITTVAGNGTAGSTGDSGLATSAELNTPSGVALDTSGNIYIADSAANRIRKVTVGTGVITTVAGNGTSGYTGDGAAATSAELAAPAGVALDTSGNIYIADYSNNVVRKVTLSSGYISTVAGTAASGYSGDGAAATSAKLKNPTGVALDSSGNIYIADSKNYVVRLVTISSGFISTFAGTHVNGYSGDGGVPSSAQLSAAGGIAVDGINNLYIADVGNNVIRRVGANTIFTSPAVGTSAAAQNVLIQTTAAETISSITAQTSYGGKQEFTVGTITGCSTNGTTSNSSGTTCVVPITFNPAYPALRLVPLIVVTGTGTSRFGLSGYGLGPLAVLYPGIISSVAGTGTAGYTGDGGAATGAEINNPLDVAVDSAENFYIADYANDIVRKVAASTGNISTVAGDGTLGHTGDGGPATAAELYNPSGLGIDAAGNIYIADKRNWRIRKVTVATGIISTVAGVLTMQGYTGDGGPATSAELNAPSGAIKFDLLGNLYFADGGACVVRKVNTTTGIINTIAGNGTCGETGDGGLATAAELYGPSISDVDINGNFYIVEYNGSRVRKVTASTGIITTVAGNGTLGFTGDGGAATSAELKLPTNMALDTAGNIYIADSGNNRIRYVNNSNGLISTIAGKGSAAYSGDGAAATSAAINAPTGIILDGTDNLWIADSGNNVIRKVNVAQSTSAFATSTGYDATDTADGALKTILTNTGTLPLITSTPATGTNPSIAANFAYDASSTCPQLTTANSPVALAAGASCTLAIDFTPAALGSISGSAILTNNSSNATGSTETIALSGTGVAVATTTTIASSANPSTYPASITFTATVAPVSGSFVPTGTVQFKIDGSNVGSAITLSGSATATYTTTSTLTGGTHTVTAAFTTNTVDCTSSTSSSFTQTVNKATPAVSWSTPSAIVYGTALSATQLNATASVPGTFVYSPASGTVLSAGAAQTLSVTFTPTDTTDYSTVPSSTTITVNKAAATIVFTSSLNPSHYGDKVKFNVNLSGTASTPTGTVTLTDSGTTLGTLTISAGTASYSTSTLTPASHSLLITYNGDSNFY